MFKISVQNRILFASDGERLSDVLLCAGLTVAHPCAGRGVCKKCTVTVNGKQELSCQYRVQSDIEVVLSEQTEIESVTGGEQASAQSQNICLVLDIGTTTLALAAVSLDENKIQQVITRTNEQVAFGANVISRIDYATKNTSAPLQEALLRTINSMIAELRCPVSDKMYVAGNTTMLHLLLNADCSSLGVAPYTPAFLESKTVNAAVLGLDGVREIVTLPCVSAFVGADLVAGRNCVTPPENGKYSLLVDLGTNAEILLFSKILTSMQPRINPAIP